MSRTKQVDRSHYEFSNYMSKRRWMSIWYQLDELLRLGPSRVLEVGPGAGVFKRLAELYGITLETLDVDPELGPDHVGSATELPFADGAYDVVCAFQVLEHLPYETALKAFSEMVRVSRSAVLISLPDAQMVWPYRVYVPGIGSKNLLVPKPFVRRRPHRFDGQHHWEVNKLGYELSRIEAEFGRFGDLVKTYRVPENPYHRFFVFNVRHAPAQSTSSQTADATAESAG